MKILKLAAVAVPLATVSAALPAGPAAADPMLERTTTCIYRENAKLFFDPKVCAQFKDGSAQKVYRTCYQNYVDANKITPAQADGYAASNVRTVLQHYRGCK